jgi:hypothetical protein
MAASQPARHATWLGAEQSPNGHALGNRMHGEGGDDGSQSTTAMASFASPAGSKAAT